MPEQFPTETSLDNLRQTCGNPPETGRNIEKYQLSWNLVVSGIR